MKGPRLGNVQLRIMRVLWEKGQANAREITEVLNQHDPIAHSTVQTLLRQLEAKEAVSHRRQERTFVFYPLVDEASVARSEIRRLTEHLFSGSTGGLVAHLLKEENISRDELDEIKRLIEAREEES
ncbi:MAG: BlaI/MecI/CopY family transcriptional regulator [Phycisphaerales bacterium]|nr:MAG: BlaI/MecI/CopY family transcriptional regulator [Phycisphaerales bacterium]